MFDQFYSEFSDLSPHPACLLSLASIFSQQIYFRSRHMLQIHTFIITEQLKLALVFPHCKNIRSHLFFARLEGAKSRWRVRVKRITLKDREENPALKELHAPRKYRFIAVGSLEWYCSSRARADGVAAGGWKKRRENGVWKCKGAYPPPPWKVDSIAY